MTTCYSGQPPVTPDALYALFDQLNIPVIRHDHPPLRTVEDSRQYRGDMEGGHAKNLYLRDRKKKNYLIIAEEDQPIDLKSMATAMGGLHSRPCRRELRYGRLWEDVFQSYIGRLDWVQD